MDQDTYEAHIAAGLAYGKDATCGKKVNYKSFSSGVKAAQAMMDKGSKDLEPYPCPWCHGWHIGRTMSEQELSRFRRVDIDTWEGEGGNYA